MYIVIDLQKIRTTNHFYLYIRFESGKLQKWCRAMRYLIMSARKYLSASEKRNIKLIDYLPAINQQNPYYRSAQELPPLSANTSNLMNRNLNFAFDYKSFENNIERSGTPFSDFFSDSETGTPDFHSEESDSSSGSVLRRTTAEATKSLCLEWECIERTLYDEDGEKCKRLNIVEECKQWRQIHPQLRIVGKALRLPQKRISYQQIEHEEVIAMHYSDYEEFSESEERLSQSSTDVTPQNSPRVSMEELYEPKLEKEKVPFYHQHEDYEPELSSSFCSLLQITPIQIRSPLPRKRQNPCILRSDVASSRWMRGNRPDSSVNCDRNSAKSYVSLDTKNYGNMVLSASDRNKFLNESRVVTARHRELGRLEPLCTPELHNNINRLSNTPHQYSIRKVSLPPLLLGDEKRKIASVSSAKKHSNKVKRNTKSFFQLDKFKYN